MVELLAERGVEVNHVTGLPLGPAVHSAVDRRSQTVHALRRRSMVRRRDLREGSRAVEVRVSGRRSLGQVIDVLVSDRRDWAAARRFFVSCLSAGQSPRDVTTDRTPTLAAAIDQLILGALDDIEQYANNRIECDHGRLKPRLRPDAAYHDQAHRQHPDPRTCVHLVPGAATTNSVPRRQPGSESGPHSRKSPRLSSAARGGPDRYARAKTDRATHNTTLPAAAYAYPTTA